MGTDNFSSPLDLLIGFNVNLYVGEEIIKGKLIGVETDHIIIKDENHYIFYYSIDKIQAITKNTKHFKSEEITTEFLKTQSLKELLHSLKNTWVTILCLNKQSFSGVLSVIESDFVTLINGDERILIKFSHISNILKGFIKEATTEKSVVSSNKKENNRDALKGEKEYKDVQTEKNKSEPKEAVPQAKVTKMDNEAVSPKVSVNDSETEIKVWSEPMKNVATVSSSTLAPKTYTESKRVKPEAKNNNHRENGKPKSNSKNVNHHVEIQQKTVALKAPVETKKQKTDIIHTINRHEKETIQKPTIALSNKIAPVRDLQKTKGETTPKNEGSQKKPQELINKGKKVQDLFEPKPLMKIESMKKNKVETKEVKPVVQEVGALRFAGEPTTNEIDRRTFFSGWPNRKNRSRLF